MIRPGRVGRLSYLQGTVSYHDAQADAWSPAAVNTPLTAGDALWTEPNGHDELSIAGTRVRMDGDTQLDIAALDDSRTRLQLDQGRLDIKTFALETNQPYQIVTPRGIAALKDQGDYYVHAGTTADPTVMGVRSGAAEFQAPNGQTIALRGRRRGSGDRRRRFDPDPQGRDAPPAMPTYWAQRDQQINYAPVQYLSADVTGYEDLGCLWQLEQRPRLRPGLGAARRRRRLDALQHRLLVLCRTVRLELGRIRSRGASRPTTTDAGRIATITGSGCRRSGASTPSTRRRWLPSSAAPSSALRSARKAVRSAGSRSARVKPTCRPTPPTAATTSASTPMRACPRPR